MFDFVNNNRQVVTIALSAVTLGLLLGGGALTYDGFQGETFVAKAGSRKITERDLAVFSRGQTMNDAMRAQTVEQLLRRAVLLNEADNQHILTTDKQLQQAILDIKEFKDDKGKFDPERYKSLVSAQQSTIPEFEARIREDKQLNVVLAGFQDAAFASRTVTDKLVDKLSAPRSMSVVMLMPAQYMDKVTVPDADIKKYYDSHLSDFRNPERVKLDYVTLSLDDLAAQATVSDADVADYYKKNEKEFASESRHARHILILADAKAKPEQKAEARKKAEALLAQVKQHPDQFGELAKKESQDPGSASKGGDLGFFGHGAMVKPFEDAAFKLKAGEISDIVQTDYGFHIIQLIEAKTNGLEEAKQRIEGVLRKKKAQADFDAKSSKFGDVVYQQPDSLKPAVDAFKLTIRNSDWVTREKAADPLLNDAKVRDAVFSDDVLKKKHNTEALEVKPGLLLAARVTASEAARTLSLEEARAAIVDKLKRQLALDLAKKDGEEKLAALKKGEKLTLTWSPPQVLNRLKAQGMPEKASEAIFGIPDDKLPGYAGVVDGDRGYMLFNITKADAAPVSADERNAITGNLQQAASQQALYGYMNDLQVKQKVEKR